MRPRSSASSVSAIGFATILGAAVLASALPAAAQDDEVVAASQMSTSGVTWFPDTPWGVSP